MRWVATKLPSRIRLELRLPPGFPEKYRTAIVRAAEGCKVKKTIAAGPVFEVVAAQPRDTSEVAPRTQNVA